MYIHFFLHYPLDTLILATIHHSSQYSDAYICIFCFLTLLLLHSIVQYSSDLFLQALDFLVRSFIIYSQRHKPLVLLLSPHHMF
jgi:hypothetical protein